MSIRIGSGIRFGTGAKAGKSFLPTDISNLDMWLRADLGVTLAAATLDTADATGWTPTSCSISTTTITDTSDGVPTLHYISHSVTSGQAGAHGTITVELKAGTLGARTGNWARIQWGTVPAANDNYVYINLDAGQLGSTGSGTKTASIYSVGSGWYRVRLVGPATSSSLVFVVIADQDGNISYTGDGTGSIEMRTYHAEQNFVSTWVDQSGNGHDVSQGTTTRRPVQISNTVNGKPSLYFDTTRTDTLQSSAYQLATGLGETVFLVFKQTVNPAVAGITYTKGTGAGGGDGMQLSMNTNGVLVGGLFDSTTAYNFRSSASGVGNYTDWFIQAGIMDPTQSFTSDELAVFLNGVSYPLSDLSSAGSATDLSGDSTVVYIGSRNGSYVMTGYVAEVIVYDKVLSWSELAKVHRYLSDRYGIPIPYHFAQYFEGVSMILDASKKVSTTGSLVDSWLDNSGNGVDFSAAGAKRPTYSATAAPNNLPAVVSTADNQVMVASGDPLAALTAGHGFVIWKMAADPPPGPTDLGAAMKFGANALTSHYPYTNGIVYSSYGSTTRYQCANPTPSMANWHCLEIKSTSSSWDGYINGGSILSFVGANTVDWRAPPTLFGSTETPQYGSLCSLAEHVLFNRELNAIERGLLVGYFNDKYSLSIT